MSKKDSKTSPPRVFSDNDTPTAPVEPSKKSLADAAGKTEFEQKQTHVLYIEFNNKLYEILNSLAVKIPANRKTYASLDKTLRTFAAIDVSRPMEEWNKQTAPYREILQTYSPENVEEFLKIAPKIPLLKAFEIEKYWNLLKPSDIESLWKHFNGLCLLSTTTSAVPVKLMTTLQNMIQKMQVTGRLDATKPYSIPDAIELVQQAMDDDEGFKQAIMEFGGQQTQVQLPPTYAKRRQNAVKDS